MIDMSSKEMRSYVRGDFSFKIKLMTITPEEYENLNTSDEEIFSHNKKKHNIDITDTGNRDIDTPQNTDLIDFLIYMDEKLDQILDFISKDVTINGRFSQGKGTDISGSGMKIVVEKSVEPGQIIHTNFVLSKFPLVFIDIFGEVVRVTPMDENGKTIYQLGIKFLDLNINDREMIIARVFQAQREAIRERKNESPGPDLVCSDNRVFQECRARAGRAGLKLET